MFCYTVFVYMYSNYWCKKREEQIEISVSIYRTLNLSGDSVNLNSEALESGKEKMHLR